MARSGLLQRQHPPPHSSAPREVVERVETQAPARRGLEVEQEEHKRLATPPVLSEKLRLPAVGLSFLPSNVQYMKNSLARCHVSSLLQNPRPQNRPSPGLREKRAQTEERTKCTPKGRHTCRRQGEEPPTQRLQWPAVAAPSRPNKPPPPMAPWQKT